MNAQRIPLATRERIALSALGLLFIILAGGLVRLQVFRHQELARDSRVNRVRVAPMIPPRGKIYDRAGHIIVDNIPSYTMTVIPAEIVAGVTMPNLAEVLQLDTAAVRRRIQKIMVNRYLPVPVKRGIDSVTVAVLEEQAARFPGVGYQIEQARQYPSDLHTECYTGFVVEASREDSAAQKEKDPRQQTDYRLLGVDYRLLGRLVGRDGLEKTYDRTLRGLEGTAYKEVSASGQVTGDYEEEHGRPARFGADIQLTIDWELQQACVALLDTFCCGAIVAIEPGTGDVLAMASFPGYDANMFSSVIPESTWQAISQDPSHPLLNRPLNGQYPPGSTTKLVTVGAALEQGIINKYTHLSPCTGGYKFGVRLFRCWERGGHGSLNAVQALAQSCDVYMYQLGLKLGIDTLSDYFTKCGFGTPTNIDLPGESPGLVPSESYYDRIFGVNKWTLGHVLNLAIGQGELLVTPLQLARFFCGLANNGIVYEPRLVRSFAYQSGNPDMVPPVIADTLPFSQATIEVLVEGLQLAVEGARGTARSLRNDYYSIGGKTGTAQNPHGENHSWFVAFAPVEDPRIVVAVIVENAGHGSEIAAPIAGRLIDLYMGSPGKTDALAVSPGED